jgi:hypothetical protein
VFARNCSMKPSIRDRPGQVCMTLLFSEVRAIGHIHVSI